MTADIEAIRARIAAATPEESGLIAHVPAEDLAALCDEIEELRAKMEYLTGQWYRAVEGAVAEGEMCARAELDDRCRQIGHALAREIRRADQAEADLERLRDEVERLRERVQRAAHVRRR